MEHLRQLDLFNPEGYEELGITLVGCGAIGSFLGPSLVRLGIKKFTLYDADFVEEHNLPLQYFVEEDIGMAKTVVVATNMKKLNSEVKVTTHPLMFTKDTKIETEVLMLATDSIKSRKLAYERAKKDGVKLIIDGRMAGEVFLVFTVDMTKTEEMEAYEKSFYEESEQSCTSRGIIYTVPNKDKGDFSQAG